MASPGALKRRPVLDSDAPDALGRKKGGNRRREKLPCALPSSRALLPHAAFLPCTPPTRAAFCSRVLPSSRVLFSRARCLLLPRTAFCSFAPARCPLLQRALSSAKACAFLFSRQHSIARNRP
jgi:hypothetical protein